MTISRKLGLISACFLLPLLTLLYFVWQGIEAQVEFAQAERSGLAYHRPLNRVLKELLTLANGGGSAAAVDAAWGEAEKVDEAHGASLQFTKEGLTSRGRAGMDVKTLRGKFAEWKSQPTPEKLQEMVSGVRTMITHLGDTSNLILDPDLDSYYLMDVQLLALPQTQERLAKIRALLAAEKLDAIEWAVAARMLKESDLDRVKADVETVLKEDGNFHGVRASLQADLPKAVAAYAAATQALVDLLEESAKSGKVTRPEEARRVAEAAFGEAFALWEVAAAELDGLLETRIETFARKRWTALGLSLLALGVALAMVWRVSGAIVGPLEECCVALEALAARDLTRRVAAEGSTELGRMGAAVNRACENFAAAVEEMRTQAELLRGTSKDQWASARELTGQSSVAAEQTRRMGEVAAATKGHFATVAAATEEMVASIAEISRQTQEATRVSGSALGSAEEMGAAADRLTETGKVIEGIIGMINSIAEQTNLLALNATIEAARVGEAGRGFAVVADEVKTLARRTAEATDDVRARVASIGGDTQAVARAAASIRTVIGEVATIQTSIAAAVEEQTVTSNEIARNLAEVTAATTEIAEDVERLAPVVARTSANATAAERSSESLTEMAGALANVAGAFRV